MSIPEDATPQEKFDWLEEAQAAKNENNLPQDLKTQVSEEEDVASKENGKSKADLLIELVPEDTLFHDDLKEPFAVLSVDGHNEVWPLRSKFFRRWLIEKFFSKTGSSPNSESMNQAIGVCDARAIIRGPEHKLSLRVAKHGDAFFYDLTDKLWRVVKITPEGWEVVDRPPVIFLRYKNTAPQVEPVRNGDIRKLLEFVNLADETDKVLLLVYIVACLIPDIPHVLPVFHGEKGAAKSTTMKVLRRIVDPAHRELFTLPSGKDELSLQLQTNYQPTYDNLDGLQGWQSNTLCQAATGGGLSKRELYTDADEVILSFLRCPVLNGINLVVSRPDLLDRALIFELKRIKPEHRHEESNFWQRFEEARPHIVGGMLNVLADAMKIYPSVKLDRLPRMADFCRWGFAIAESMGIGGHTFLEAYSANMAKANDEAIASNPVAGAIVSMMTDREKWQGSASELLRALNLVAENEKINIKAKSWPQAARALTRRIKHVKSNLLDTGITLIEGYDNHRKIAVFTLIKDSENIPAMPAISANRSEPWDSACGDTLSQSNISPQLYPQYKPNNDAVCGVSGDSGDKNGDPSGETPAEEDSMEEVINTLQSPSL